MAGETVRYQGISPYYYYEDANAALEWLSRVLGFEEVVRYSDAEGAVHEAEMRAGDVVLQISGYPGYWAEQKADGPTGQENILYVNDVDAHWARTVAAGVEAEQPTDKPYGVRAYALTDLGGHRWGFWQRLTDKVEIPPDWREIRSGE